LTEEAKPRHPANEKPENPAHASASASPLRMRYGKASATVAPFHHPHHAYLDRGAKEYGVEMDRIPSGD